MPHIFPRRFLRTRDVLDPTELNDDIHPVYDLTRARISIHTCLKSRVGIAFTR